jgi:hypothetical protein
LPLLLGCYSHHVGSLRGCRRDGRCCRCAAPHQYGSEFGFICPGKACASVRLCRPLLASAIDLPVQRPHGSGACDANKTRPCSFNLTEVAYWYVPAVCAQLGIKPCAFGWQTRVQLRLRHSSTDRPLAGRFVRTVRLQAACSLRYTSGMHVRSRQRLDSFRKVAGGGICARYGVIM